MNTEPKSLTEIASENVALRKIIRECVDALGTSACVGEGSSLLFLLDVPKEIKSTVDALRLRGNATSRLLKALDGMDRGCTTPGFKGHQNGYGEESAGDELQAAREALALLVGHVAPPEMEEPEVN